MSKKNRKATVLVMNCKMKELSWQKKSGKWRNNTSSKRENYWTCVALREGEEDQEFDFIMLIILCKSVNKIITILRCSRSRVPFKLKIILLTTQVPNINGPSANRNDFLDRNHSTILPYCSCNQSCYDIPSTISKRRTSIGFGDRVKFFEGKKHTL